jgi:catechol 2,3-dioxygenase-like lactoylglutathione lyase family enzyme
MARGIDHIVHTVRDLDAAGELYARLGFTVGARNRHPWGTDNRIVQFPGCFIELLTIAQPEKIAPRGPRLFSFGVFNRDFLARHEGLSMIALESRDAAADARAFREAGIGDFDVFDFEREARKPDGTPVKVAFSLAYAQDEKSPEAGFFVCQQHHPENFWNPAFQKHPNGAIGIAGVIMVSENPESHRRFLSAFSGVSDVKSGANGIAVETPRGAIQVISPDAYRMHVGTEPPDLSRGARLAAIRFAVPDQALLKGMLGKGGVAFSEHRGNVVVAPDVATGATLIFGG